MAVQPREVTCVPTMTSFEGGDAKEHLDMLEVEPAGGSMLDLLNGFVAELRAAGLPVSLTENLDAMEAIRYIPLEDRNAFNYSLAATLVKNHSHWKAFETVFEVYFSLRGADYRLNNGEELDADEELTKLLDEMLGQQQDGQQGRGGGMEGLTPEQLAEMLYRALQQGDEAMMQALARQAVTRFAGMEPGRPVGGTYYLYRTLRNLDLDGVLQRLLEHAQETADGGLTPLEERLAKD